MSRRSEVGVKPRGRGSKKGAEMGLAHRISRRMRRLPAAERPTDLGAERPDADHPIHR